MLLLSRVTRRAALAGAAGALAALDGGGLARASARDDAGSGLAALERRSRGRLGVAVLDARGDLRVAHRGDERFPLCSTFKTLVAGLVLARADEGKENLARRVIYGESDLLDYAPVTKKRVGEGGMTVAELCDAAVTWSDNTAANLLLASFGGPAALTRYCRSLGDEITRLDRIEPELNEAAAGDARDTTTPAAMAATLRKIALGDALSPASREQITAWLLANKTGDTRLRAGLPKYWRVGDKTGSGENGTANDVAVAWPPNRAPLVIAAYLTQSPLPPDERSTVLAEVGRIASALDEA